MPVASNPDAHAAAHTDASPGEKDTKLSQKLGQLQPLQLCSHRSALANLHVLSQPNTFLALGVGLAAHPAAGAFVFFMSAGDVAAALNADAHGAFARIAVVAGMAIIQFQR